MLQENEIIKHIGFFQRCESDHKQLAERLIKELAIQLQVEIDFELPIRTFKPFYSTSQGGKINDWNYFFHGYHCFFENSITTQKIEVSLVSGSDFGTLDRVFFIDYILSTKEYYPLPINDLDRNVDGATIIKLLKQLK
jgi:hypothetical protein